MKFPRNPYVVPPFQVPERTKPSVRYFWWSWHPNYPYWGKSCWGGETEDEAWESLNKPFADSMRVYHNKLIREGDGKFTEVYDLPCQELDVWREIARNKNGWRKPTDAQPIIGWEKG